MEETSMIINRKIFDKVWTLDKTRNYLSSSKIFGRENERERKKRPEYMFRWFAYNSLLKLYNLDKILM